MSGKETGRQNECIYHDSYYTKPEYSCSCCGCNLADQQLARQGIFLFGAVLHCDYGEQYRSPD